MFNNAQEIINKVQTYLDEYKQINNMEDIGITISILTPASHIIKFAIHTVRDNKEVLDPISIVMPVWMMHKANIDKCVDMITTFFYAAIDEARAIANPAVAAQGLPTRLPSPRGKKE